MKKYLTALLILLPAVSQAKLNVVTTIPDLAALTREVGQDLAEVTSLCRGDQDPHFLEPRPSLALALNKADLLVEVGLQLEIGWLPVLITQSRNPRILAGAPGHLAASEGIRILEVPTGPVDRSQGDVHPDGNPHYWLDPRNGLIIARRITARLSELDPVNAPTFERNLKDFEKRLGGRLRRWEREIAPLRGKKIITHHKSFSYFVDWTGLEIAGLIEPKPGIPPSPAHIRSLLELVPAEKIPLLITENYYDPRPARELAVRSGARFLILPTSVGGEAENYLDLFDFLVSKLREALS